MKCIGQGLNKTDKTDKSNYSKTSAPGSRNIIFRLLFDKKQRYIRRFLQRKPLMNNLSKIINDLVENHFPELKGIKIKATYLKDWNEGIFEYGRIHDNEYEITVNTAMKTAPVPVLKGGLAHEICHIIGDANLRGIRSFVDDLLYRYFRNYRSMVERNTDLMVIERGLGRELLDLLYYRMKIGLPEYDDNGLTTAELTNLLGVSQERTSPTIIQAKPLNAEA